MPGSNLLIRRGEGFPEGDPFRMYLSLLPDLRTYAREAVKEAYSYRPEPVEVGSAAFSIVEGSEIWALTYGYNTKAEHDEKSCAEKKDLEAAEDEGMTRTIGMFNVSDNTIEQNRSITDIPSLNLPPCSVCHGDFRAHPVARPEMLIATGGLKHDTVQINTAERFLRLQTEEPDLVLYESYVGGLDGERLVRAYDRLKSQQKFSPEVKRLEPHQLVITAVLSHRDLIV